MYILEDAADVTAFSQLIRSFFATVDTAVYYFISIIYNLIEDLANTSILSISQMNEFASRIYALLGIFMLFKVSFSIISYIVSPDKISDNTTGMGGIIKNVLITLILILVVPTGFRILYETQSAILSENIIPKLLLGQDSDVDQSGDEFYMSPACKELVDDGNISKSNIPSAIDKGNYISLMIFRSFYQVGHVEESEKEYFNERFIQYYCGFGEDTLDVSYFLQSEIYNGPIEKIPEEKTALDEFIDAYRAWNAVHTAGFSELIINLGMGVGRFIESSLGLGPTTYFISYNYFISTIVGVFASVILISMAFEVAIRSVKLTFLQLISPIPIISYIDPKSGKDGMFKRWYTEVFKTWASLFIRFLALFFGVYLIQQLDGLHTIDPNREYLSGEIWIKLFMLLGVLMFCKELPKLLEQLIPGMKDSGSFKLNPLKRIRDDAIGGKVITGAAIGAGAMGAAAVGSAGANAIHARMNGKNWKETFKNAGRGLGTGAFYGAKNGFAAGKEGKYNFMKQAGESIKQSSKHRNYEDMLAAQGEIKGPFKAVQSQAWDKFTDMIGQQAPMGGTSIVRGKIRELNEQLDQEQGRETQYNTAFGNLTASRPERTPGYVEAAKYSVTRDNNGNFVGKMEYQSYKDYMSKITGDKNKINQLEADIENNLQGSFASELDRKKAVQRALNRKLESEYANNAKFITADEFNQVQSLGSAIAESSAIQKDLKSQIGKIESNQLGESKK